jgi:integrase
MTRSIHRLTALAVNRVKRRGLHADGGGLFLQIARNGSRSWLFRYTLNAKTRHMGLGSLEVISLASARTAALECRRLCHAGIDPIEHRNASRTEAKLAAARAMTFDDCADRYMTAHATGWRNSKHRAQWAATLRTYVTPIFGSLPIQEIDTGLIMRVLEPIWPTKPETASRVRGRIEAVLNWATTRGFRRGENPARWRGHLENLLPNRSRVQKVTHHAALPYVDIGTFMADLRERTGVAAAALEFLILTAARTSEVIGARWQEIDLSAEMWVVPADRMKAREVHRVPLSKAALAVLERMSAIRQDEFIFPSAKNGKPLSNMALLVLLRRMGRADLTAHGFRSTFRDWAAERTNFPREVVEMALAHTITNKVEAAYRRGDFDKRRRLIDAWAENCAATSNVPKAVVPLRTNA